ncbi:ABC transporter ATP-binding protein [Brucellaceae bacterium C25G]
MNTPQNPQSKNIHASALELVSVYKKFGTTEALNDLSLSIESGEVVCLVGHSGCGKTTLLKIISGVDTPNAGSIRINGSEVAGDNQFIEPENRKVGVVFQDYALFPHLTIEQNIMFGLRKEKKALAKERTHDLLNLVNLTHMSDKYPHMLSGGEQQRIALARALAPKPDILLMDEPFSNLDRNLRDQLRSDTISLLRKFGTTVIFVTHDAEEALSTGDKIVLMRHGRIVQQGTPRALYDEPCCRYTADFFCDYNVINGMVGAGQIETALGIFPAEYTGDRVPVAVYLRPTDITPNLEQSLCGTSILAQIVSRKFLGDMEELILKVQDHPAPLKMRTALRLPSEIKEIYVNIKPESPLFFNL